MPDIPIRDITLTVSRLCNEATPYLPADVPTALQITEAREASPLGKLILGKILLTAQITRAEQLSANFTIVVPRAIHCDLSSLPTLEHPAQHTDYHSH